jgi:Zn-finger nucleic acid-binding protein
MGMRRPRATEESKARAARISRALADLLPDAPLPSPAAQPQAATGRGGDCPGCGAQLQATAGSHGVEIDACGGCGGIWLDAGELEHLTSGLDPAAGAGAPDEAALRARLAAAPAEADMRYRECPRCHEVMHRRNFGTISGVIVDECPKHGLFLDAGELEAVEAFLRAGGRAIGEAARARTKARQLPPPPLDLRTQREVRAETTAVSAVDVLWNMFFS